MSNDNKQSVKWKETNSQIIQKQNITMFSTLNIVKYLGKNKNISISKIEYL